MTPSERLDATFIALADPTRRAIIARLASGEASVTELAQPFAMSQPAISKHLKVLERAGLISRGRDGQRRPCRIEAKSLADASAWLETYRRFAAVVKVPVLANITEFGATPLYTVEELARADVSLVLYPLSAFRAMSAAALNVYRTIRAEGSQKKRAPKHADAC